MHVQNNHKSGYLTPVFARQCNAVCPFRLLSLIVQRKYEKEDSIDDR